MWHGELPQPGLKPASLAVEAQSFNEWVTREVKDFSVLTPPNFYLPPDLFTGN